MVSLPPAHGGFLLGNLAQQAQTIPDLRVRVSAIATSREVDGVLGMLDFLAQFEEICFHTPSMTLTLTDP